MCRMFPLVYTMSQSKKKKNNFTHVTLILLHYIRSSHVIKMHERCHCINALLLLLYLERNRIRTPLLLNLRF